MYILRENLTEIKMIKKQIKMYILRENSAPFQPVSFQSNYVIKIAKKAYFDFQVTGAGCRCPSSCTTNTANVFHKNQV